jgi:hypothetical protein
LGERVSSILEVAGRSTTVACKTKAVTNWLRSSGLYSDKVAQMTEKEPIDIRIEVVQSVNTLLSEKQHQTPDLSRSRSHLPFFRCPFHPYDKRWHRRDQRRNGIPPRRLQKLDLPNCKTLTWVWLSK